MKGGFTDKHIDLASKSFLLQGRGIVTHRDILFDTDATILGYPKDMAQKNCKIMEEKKNPRYLLADKTLTNKALLGKPRNLGLFTYLSPYLPQKRVLHF